MEERGKRAEGYRQEQRAAEYLQEKDLKAQIQIIKGVVRCENCGAEVAKESAFCPSCGNKMPEIVQPVVEQPVAEAKKCANCGATLDNGALFCSECGTKVE